MDQSNNVSYSTKELIGQLDSKLDRILDRLDKKVDREDLERLSSRVTEIELHGSKQATEAISEAKALEVRLVALERIQSERGYLVSEFKAAQDRLERHNERLGKLEDGISSSIRSAIAENNKEIRQAAERSFSKREKVFLGGFALIGAVGTIISTVVLLIQVGAHP